MRVSISNHQLKGKSLLHPQRVILTGYNLAAFRKNQLYVTSDSADTLATIRASEMFGALIEREEENLIIHGVNGKPMFRKM